MLSGLEVRQVWDIHASRKVNKMPKLNICILISSKFLIEISQEKGDNMFNAAR